MPEWLMGADCKSASIAYVGSNPTRPRIYSINLKENINQVLVTMYNMEQGQI